MPSKKSARASRRKYIFNRPVRTRSRTLVGKATSLVRQGDQNTMGQGVKEAVSALDKAAQKGAIHPNNAARQKSRLMRRLNTASGGDADTKA